MDRMITYTNYHILKGLHTTMRQFFKAQLREVKKIAHESSDKQ